MVLWSTKAKETAIKYLIAVLLSALLITYIQSTPVNKKVSHATSAQVATVAKKSSTSSKNVIPQPVKKVAAVKTPKPHKPVYPAGSHELLMSQAGISPADFGAVDYIVSHESGWCSTKWEGEIGGCPAYHGVSDYDGYGLCQSTPPQKMASAGSDWKTNPVTQLKWCNSYAISRYGSWWQSYNHWVAHHNW
jgi:hypothetical protein